jgi:hypothetical protein
LIILIMFGQEYKSSLHSLILFRPSLLSHSTVISRDFRNYYTLSWSGILII